jgi:hypothetical protein
MTAVRGLVADANSQELGASTLMIPEEITELVTANTTVIFNVTMTLGAQSVLNTTSILLQPFPII